MRKPKNSSNSSRGSGNTKQIPPARNWFFTLNNYSEDDIQEIRGIKCSIVPRFVFQEETGESGTPHLQGYIQFATKKRPKGIFKNKRIHWEKVRNVRKAIEYCQKEDTRTGKVFYRGIEPKYTVKINRWEPWMYKVRSIVEAEPDCRKIHWIWEAVGNRGKTLLSKWLFLNMPNVVILSGKAADMKNAIVQYIQTNHVHPRTILINIPRSSAKWVSYAGIEVIKDMLFYSGKYEGGMVCGPNPHVIVMANEPPDRESVSDDQWDVINI